MYTHIYTHIYNIGVNLLHINDIHAHISNMEIRDKPTPNYLPLSTLLSRFFIQEWLLPLTKCNSAITTWSVFMESNYIVIAILLSRNAKN